MGIYKVYLYNYREKKEFWKCLFMMKKEGVTLLFLRFFCNRAQLENVGELFFSYFRLHPCCEIEDA